MNHDPHQRSPRNTQRLALPQGGAANPGATRRQQKCSEYGVLFRAELE